MATSVLYLRIDSEVKDRLKTLADECGMTLNSVTAVVLRKGLGMPLELAILLERLESRE